MVIMRGELERRGLVAMLQDLYEPSVVHACANFSQATSLLKQHIFNIILLDSDASEDFALFVPLITDENLKLLVLLRDLRSETLCIPADLKADGFMLASSLTPESLKDALKRLRAGHMAIQSEIAIHMIARSAGSNEPKPLPVSLTPRERQTLYLLSQGLSNKQIASRLGVSQNSAKRYVANILAKLNSGNRTLAVSHAIRMGLLDGFSNNN